MEASWVSDSESEAVVQKRAFERTNRGKYLKDKTEEELEADDEFWGQDALKEEENDQVYETESEPEDIPDSDFDKPEDDADEDEEGIQKDLSEKKKVNKKKSSKYLETIPGMKKAIALLRKRKKAEKERLEKQQGEQGDLVEDDDDSDLEDDVRQNSQSRRKSSTNKGSRKSSKSSLLDLDRLEKYESGRQKKKKRKGLISKKMSIRQVMREAANTEWDNLASLEQLMAREEEVKKKAVVDRKETDQPVIRYKSSIYNGQEVTTVSVLNCEDTPEQFTPKFASDPPEKQYCAVTQQPAKYIDPITKTPYATLQAYKILYPQSNLEEQLGHGQRQGKRSYVGQGGSKSDYKNVDKLDLIATKYLVGYLV